MDCDNCRETCMYVMDARRLLGNKVERKRKNKGLWTTLTLKKPQVITLSSNVLFPKILTGEASNMVLCGSVEMQRDFKGHILIDFIR